MEKIDQLNDDDFVDLLNSGKSCLIQVIEQGYSMEFVDSDDFDLRMQKLGYYAMRKIIVLIFVFL